MFLEDLYF